MRRIERNACRSVRFKRKWMKKRKKDLCEMPVSKRPFRGCYRKRTSIKVKEGKRERKREKGERRGWEENVVRQISSLRCNLISRLQIFRRTSETRYLPDSVHEFIKLDRVGFVSFFSRSLRFSRLGLARKWKRELFSWDWAKIGRRTF